MPGETINYIPSEATELSSENEKRCKETVDFWRVDPAIVSTPQHELAMEINYPDLTNEVKELILKFIDLSKDHNNQIALTKADYQDKIDKLKEIEQKLLDLSTQLRQDKKDFNDPNYRTQVEELRSFIINHRNNHEHIDPHDIHTKEIRIEKEYLPQLHSNLSTLNFLNDSIVTQIYRLKELIDHHS
jgi:hypothetical protein